MRSFCSSRHPCVLLTLVVLAVSLTVLVAGWGFGFEPLVRWQAGQNASVPVSALCIALISFASLRSGKRFRPVQAAALGAALIFVVLASIPALDRSVWLLTSPRAGDGCALATRIGLVLASLSPAIRLGVVRLPADWRFHAPFFGLVAAGLAVVLISLDPELANLIPSFGGLSLLTAVLMACLFAAQLLDQLRTEGLAAERDDDVQSA